MQETYVECLVKQHSNPIMKFLKYLAIVLTVLLVLAGMAVGAPLALILAIAFGVLAYYASLNSDIEFEYLYCDREVSIDKIASQSKRKRVATYEVDKMEILAPINSYKLDDYKNRQCKVVDYSSKIEDKPDKRYVFYYEGQKKVIIEPSESFVKAIYNVAPRKVFTN